MWNIIKDKILKGVTMYIPSTLPFALWKTDKWKRPIDREIRNMIKNKSLLWRRYIRSKDPSTFMQYTKLRNNVRNNTRSVEKRHKNEITKASKENPKHFWRYVKQKL